MTVQCGYLHFLPSAEVFSIFAIKTPCTGIFRNTLYPLIPESGHIKSRYVFIGHYTTSEPGSIHYSGGF
jgi:hypothetical protein